MISTNFPEIIRAQLAERIDISIAGDGYSISLPFVFDDGDPCGFNLTPADGGWLLSDHGATITRAGYAGVDLLTRGYVERLRKITGFYGIAEDKGELLLPVLQDDFSDGIYTFTQACLEIVNLAKTPKEKKATEKTHFAHQLGRLIEKTLPKEVWTHIWHDPKHDPQKIYTVDYHITGKTRDWFLFGIPTQMSALRATVACYHYKQAQLDFGSVAIYDHEEKLSPKDTLPLNEVADKTFPRVSERKAIQDFLVAAAA